MKIIIAGHGKLAHKIVEDLPEKITCTTDFWENRHTYNDQNAVIIHVGSGRQINEIIQYCNEFSCPLIQGSTGIAYDVKTVINFPCVESPNLSILIIKFLMMLKKFGKYLSSYEISIMESHQASKTSLPGTAVDIAHSLNVDPDIIQSIRAPKEQLRLMNIPQEFLQQHAVHKVTIKNSSSEIQFKTEIFGLDSYIDGLAKIVAIIDKLENKHYHITELVEMELL